MLQRYGILFQRSAKIYELYEYLQSAAGLKKENAAKF